MKKLSAAWDYLWNFFDPPCFWFVFLVLVALILALALGIKWLMDNLPGLMNPGY